MDFIIDHLGVVAESIDTFMSNLLWVEALAILAGFVGGIFLLMLIHIALGNKATTTRHALAIAKYFNSNYIGSSLDAKKFLRKKKRLLNRDAREEFSMFINSTSRLQDTTFAKSVMLKGRHELELTMPLFNYVIAIGTIFVSLKAYFEYLKPMEVFIVVGVSLGAMLILKAVLFLSIRLVNRNYLKARRKLNASLPSVRYNNEYLGNTQDFDDTIEYYAPDNGTEEVIRRMQSVESTLDGDTQQMILDSIGDVKKGLSSEDEKRYDEFLSKLANDNIAN